MSAGWKQKRFWKAAEAQPVDGGYAIVLDGRPVKTPAKAALHVPTRALAQAVAAEWDAQEDDVRPETMPVTRSANAAIDKVRIQHPEVAAMLSDYGDSDLLCYRAASPAELAARQAAAWDPLLDWAETRYRARLETRLGIMHAGQDAAALQRLAAAVAAHDAFEMTALHDLVSISGSLVIGLAVSEGHIDAQAGWDVSRIDELWQEEQWGADEEATRMAAHKHAAFLHAARFLTLVRDKS